MAKRLQLRVVVEITPEGSYNTLSHASSTQVFDHTQQVSALISDAQSDVQAMILAAVKMTPVATAVHDMKEAADAQGNGPASE